MRRFAATAAVILIAARCASIPAPAPRSGPPAAGSARWAYAIAQPSIAAFAPDAALYEILGAQVYRDGRLPSNTGDRSFVAWSPNLRQTLQVTVKFDGSFATATRNENASPSPNGQPLASPWADSPTVFAVAAPYLTCGVTVAQLAVLNAASYAEAPNQAVWGIHYDVGQNQLVKWDGSYIGPQGAPDVPCAGNLKSEFPKADVCANRVTAGVPYDMNDPAWIVNQSDQNRETCAYKFLAGFHILGYNTEDGDPNAADPQVRALQLFQSAAALPVSTLLTADALRQLDTLLVVRESNIGQAAAAFPLYKHMQPLHPNDVSKNWLAYIYQLPMSVLLPNLQMGADEIAQCIWGECNGFLQDADGANLPCQQPGCYTTDLTVDYRFAGAYFDPRTANARLPSAAVHVATVLHEYSHYLDGINGGTYAGLPHLRMIATRDFYNMSYDMNQVQGNICAPRRGNDPKDWVTKYGFVGAAQCPAETEDFLEEWAEAFSMYVSAGKVFRAAAQQNATIAQKYAWLKTNVFQGIEYDTDLQRGVESECNDIPGYQQSAPGYASCSGSYIWDAELRVK